MANDIYEFTIIPQQERYYNDDSSYGVYAFTTNDDIPEFYDCKSDPFDDNSPKVKGSTLAGKMQRLSIGMEYKVKAKLAYSAKYKSYNYAPQVVISNVPKTIEQQAAFLKTMVTPLQAENILNLYPNVVEDIMQNKEINYEKIKGIGQITWEKIKERILDNYVVSDILTMLQPLGVTFVMIKKLISEEENPALLKEKLHDNPYMMTKIHGLGFRKVDDLALKINPEMRISQKRTMAFIKYYFTSVGESDGHTWVKKDILDDAVRDNINECFDVYEKVIEQEKEGGRFLYFYEDKVGLKSYHDKEYAVYEILKDLNKYSSSFKIDIDKGIELAESEQGFKFTDEQKEKITKSCESNVVLISGLAGCVDCDTEFFNGTEWKKIAEYQDGDKVLQYNENGTAELVYPLNYIRQKADYLWHFETKYGLDQCLSDNHICYYISPKGKLYKEPFSAVKEKQLSYTGFWGRFLTSFNYTGTGIDLSDDEIRLMVAVFADGSFYPLEHCTNCKTRARFHLKKERKKERLKGILQRLNYNYKEVPSVTTGYSEYYVDVPMRQKHFPIEWYNCTQEQFKVIADEVMYWDGSFVKKNCYSTTSKSDADFIQFVFSSIGYRATITINDRTGKNYLTCGKIYTRKSVEYCVSYTTRTLIGMCNDCRANHTKTPIEKYKTKDGYEYCFTVPSHLLVLRRNNKIFITGNCGKTTILRGLIKIYQQSNYSIAACALSAKAAQRITEATGLKATTIHRLLGSNTISFTYNAEYRLSNDVIILDEASMVNVPIFYALLSAVKEGAKVIICGDDGQLPPIGYGNIFHDLLNMSDFNSCKLTKILRQAERSGIISDSQKIRNNENPLPYPQLKVVTGELQDMTYMFRENREGMRDLAIKLFFKAVEKDGLDNTIIITPCKQDRTNSTEEINSIIQDELIDKSAVSIKYGNKEFRVGAKVIQRANNYEKNVFNGEIGYVVSIKQTDKTRIMNVDFGSKIVPFNQNELANVELAYALTIHVCQGSGYDNVIAIIDNTHFKLLDSCLLYTALTRAKKKCLLIAEPSAYTQCIKHKASQRQTWLGLRK